MEKYHLINQIGEGSFGRVYKARRKYTSRMVAIKMINKLGQTKDDLISFRREIDILKKVDHPNIMRMLDVYETDTDFCVVSEFARGDLFQIIEDNQTLPENVLQNLAYQLVAALQHLHQSRIIHRDIKPQNILISSQGLIKLCDFGFARALSCTTLVLTSIKGTPLYMAPELVQERPYDEKIDIWSLGIILYELFYGKPPFFTDSIYKLIQMIVNDTIAWPGKISDDFKDFLLLMLQKDPVHRASCGQLLQHPFITNVSFDSNYDNLYHFKTEQFDEALNDPDTANFKPLESSEPDFQSIFMNPNAHTPEEMLIALKHLNSLDSSSPLSDSFAFHFSDFISKPTVVDEAIKAATKLIRQNPQKYLVSFSVGISLLWNPEMPQSAVELFVEILAIPFCQAQIHLDPFQEYDFQFDDGNAEHLIDRLLSFLFVSDNTFLYKIYILISYLLQVNHTFLTSFSTNYASKALPIITSAVINRPSQLITAASISILTKVVEHNNSAFHHILPMNEFLDSLFNIVKDVPDDIPSFACFSAALTFFSTAFSLLAQSSDFQRKISNPTRLLNFPTFVSTCLQLEPSIEPLLTIGASMPQDPLDLISYVSVLVSPFSLVQLDEFLLEVCVERIPYLLPIHVPPLLTSILSLSPDIIIQYLPPLLGLFSIHSCAERICDFVLRMIAEDRKDYSEIIDNLCEAGIIPSICGVINDAGPQAPSSLTLLLTHIVLRYSSPSKILRDNCAEILQTVFSVEEFVENALIIAAHYARLSSDFLSPLIQAGALICAERCITSEFAVIRARASSLLGNITKHAELPYDFSEENMPKLMQELRDENIECRKFAALAIGNQIFHNHDYCSYIENDFDTILNLFDCRDPKTVEYAAFLLANFIKNDDKNLAFVIQRGGLDKMIGMLNEIDEIATTVIVPLTAFCLNEESRKIIKNKGVTITLHKFTKSTNQAIKTASFSIIMSLEP